MSLQSSCCTGVKRCVFLMSTFIPNASFSSATAPRTLLISDATSALSSFFALMASSPTVRWPVFFEPDLTCAQGCKDQAVASVIFVPCPVITESLCTIGFCPFRSSNFQATSTCFFLKVPLSKFAAPQNHQLRLNFSSWNC